MTKIRVKVADCPTEFAPYGPIRLAVPTKSGYDFGDGDEFEIEAERVADRKGVMQWKGGSITHHGDGRRFIYLAWLAKRGNGWHMFRRIKVFLELIDELSDDAPDSVSVTIRGVGKDGSPACATAKRAEPAG